MENASEQNVAPVIPQGLQDLSSALEGLPGAREILAETGSDAVKAGVIKMEAPAAQASIAANTNPPQSAAPESQTPPEQNPAEQTPDTSNEPLEEDEETANNPLLKSVKGKMAPKQEVVYENFDQIKADAQKVFGIQMKDEKDFGKIFQSAKKMREAAQKAGELEKKVSELNDIFEKMPSSLINATKAYFEGRSDWDAEISNRPKFDFTKPADKQDIQSLVNHYFPGEFSAEDFDSDEPIKALEIAKKSSIEKFNVDKRGLEKESADLARDAQARRDARQNSIDSSLKFLSQSFPDLDLNSIKDVVKIMESGDVNSLFYNRDGSFKPEAAEAIMLAKHGKSTISSLMNISAKRAESKANEEILTRAADKPNPQKGGGVASKELDAKTVKAIDALVGGLNKSKTY